jgi:hypothetical protein
MRATTRIWLSVIVLSTAALFLWGPGAARAEETSAPSPSGDVVVSAEGPGYLQLVRHPRRYRYYGDGPYARRYYRSPYAYNSFYYNYYPRSYRSDYYRPYPYDYAYPRAPLYYGPIYYGYSSPYYYGYSTPYYYGYGYSPSFGFSIRF